MGSCWNKIQRRCRAVFRKAAPVFNNIKKVYEKFRFNGSSWTSLWRSGAQPPFVPELSGILTFMKRHLVIIDNYGPLAINHSNYATDCITKRTWTISFANEITMICCVLYLFYNFKMLHGFTSSPVSQFDRRLLRVVEKALFNNYQDRILPYW